MIDLNQIAKAMQAATKKRESNGANIKTDTLSMLKHTATEVVEAMEAYTRWEWDDNNSPAYTMGLFASELADIIACTLIICANERINVEVALAECLDKNEKRANGVGDKK